MLADQIAGLRVKDSADNCAGAGCACAAVTSRIRDATAPENARNMGDPRHNPTWVRPAARAWLACRYPLFAAREIRSAAIGLGRRGCAELRKLRQGGIGRDPG